MSLSLTDITFPVFRLGESEPIVEKGITFYLSVTEDENETHFYKYKIIDDKNIKGKTLAQRRLRIITQGRQIQRITRAVFFIADLLKLAKSTTWFIDSTGRLFNYKKSTYKNLIYRKIAEVLPLPNSGAILQVEGINTRFKSLFAPMQEEKYAGLLELGTNQYVLYGLYKEQLKSTKRMI